MSEATTPPPWNPYLTYVWTTRQMQAWVDQNGNWGCWDGKRWAMISKRICPGRYEVKFKECE